MLINIIELTVLDSCRIRIPSNTSSSGYKTQYSSICGENGKCVESGDGADDYKCECNMGYHGSHCQISELLFDIHVGSLCVHVLVLINVIWGTMDYIVK